MPPYEAFDCDAEVNGRSLLTVVDGALAEYSTEYQQRAREALAENGIGDPELGEWYPQQAWLDTFESIGSELEPHILDRIGEHIPEFVDWPSEPSTVPEGLNAIDEAYQRNHRGGDIGCYRFEQTGDRSGTVTCRNPYPCPFDKGIIRATARQHAPVESFVVVEERGSECRADGAATCTYTVTW
jgi:hypothetical protein